MSADGVDPRRRPVDAAAPRCIGCIVLALAVVAAVIGSFAYLAVDYRQLFSDESLRLMAAFVREFFPPDLTPAFVAKAAWGALQTLAVAAVGTLLAVGFGAAIALPAAGRSGLRRGWRPGSCSTCCAACPSWSGRR